MRKKIKKFFEKREIIISIEQPDYKVEYMYLNQDQIRNTYKFLCDRYIKHLKSWEYESAQTVKKIIEDYIIIGEKQWFNEFKNILNIK